MPETSAVPMDLWRDLYEAAVRFKELEPWTFMDEGQLFAVRDISSGQTGYGCVLGAGGEMFALCLYRGAAGFDAYRRLFSREVLPGSDDSFTIQDCLMASFEDRDFLQKADRAVLKALGLKFRGANAWPAFRSHLPGYLPWILSTEEVLFLTEALLCARTVATKVKDEALDLRARPGQVLTHTPAAAGGFEESWEPIPAYRPPPLPPLELDPESVARARSKAARRGGAWEAHAYFAPTPIEGEGRPYYPRMALAVDAPSGYVFQPELGTPGDGPHQLLAQALLESIQAAGALPSEIHVKDAGLAQALTPLGAALGVPVALRKHLPALEEAREEMESMFGGRS